MKGLPKAPSRSLKTVLRLALITASFVSSFIAYSAQLQSDKLTLSGHFTQGGMLVGEAKQPVESVKIGTVKVPVHPNQTLFTFGFTRDQKANETLSVIYKDGSKETLELDIKQRDYKIERVNGVASKYVSPPQSVLDRIRDDVKRVKAAREKLSFRSDFTQTAIAPTKGRISGVYGSQRIFNGVPKNPHFGQDIAVPTGTKVVAPIDGKVIFADPDLYYSGGTLIIDHGMGISSTYIHLSKITVKVGDEIKQGQKVAEVGATGRVTGPHLDWRINWFQRRLDPALWLK